MSGAETPDAPGLSDAPGVPSEVRDALGGAPVVGTLDCAHALLTVDACGRVDVCLVSRAEVGTTASSIQVVVASSAARRNLAATMRATFMTIAGDAAYYLALRVVRILDDEGAMAAEMVVERVRRDDIGVELHPIRFRVDARLAVMEHWDKSRALLDRLDRAARGAAQ